MKLSQFKFKLPEDRIAQYPVEHRDESRLMVVHKKSDAIEHVLFKDILNYFDEKDVFVFNDTRVFPARMYGNKEKTGACIEVFLLRELREENLLWDVQVDPARKIRIGNKLYFGEDNSMVAEVIDNTTSRGRVLRFLYDGPHDEFKKALYALGESPIPTYLKRKACAWSYNQDGTVNPVPTAQMTSNDYSDDECFQTIFAENEGAVTAPTAGMHFSRELMKRMEIRGINFAYITLHCGLGCFDPIEVEDLTKHKMTSEQMFVPKEACELVNKTKLDGHRVCCVGVSTARATETAVGTDGLLKEYEGWTNKFIFPPYEFGLSNALVANFYHPESPMMMTQASFGGYDLVYECYKQAVKNEYKFGCYGDALLIVDD